MSEFEKDIAQEVPVQEQFKCKNENHIISDKRFKFMDDDEYIVSEETINNIKFINTNKAKYQTIFNGILFVKFIS